MFESHRQNIAPQYATLGTNPRRLNRFATTLAVWQEVAERLPKGHGLSFSPLQPGNVDLFLKLTLIGYINSAVITQMQRDPDLVERLEQISNALGSRKSAQEQQKQFATALGTELSVVPEPGWIPFCGAH